MDKIELERGYYLVETTFEDRREAEEIKKYNPCFTDPTWLERWEIYTGDKIRIGWMILGENRYSCHSYTPNGPYVHFPAGISARQAGSMFIGLIEQVDAEWCQEVDINGNPN